MEDIDPHMKVVNPDPPRKPLDAAAKAQIAALVDRQLKTGNVLMRLISMAGGQVEDALKLLPKSARSQLDKAASQALQRSYDFASRSQSAPIRGDRAHKAMATLSGALGGLGGIPTALIELPIATTVIFRAVQNVAEEYGEDSLSVETRMECLRVFGSGGPGDQDDGIDTTFVGARLSLTGGAVNKLISTIAPKFAAVFGQKLATQAVPVLGAVAGASTNLAFTDYYVEMAHVHFGLRAIARDYGDAAVVEEFHQQLAKRTLPVTQV